jgi:hypothetical protein
MQTVTEIVAEVLDRGLQDWISLGELAWVVRYSAGLSDSNEIKNTVKQVVEELLKKEYATVGDLILVENGNKIEFKPWSLGIYETINQIDRVWEECGELDASHACWVSNTHKGDDWIRHRHRPAQ